MSEGIVSVELEKRIRALDVLKDECLSVEDLSVSEKDKIFDHYKRAKINLRVIYEIECSVDEDFSKNKRDWLDHRNYGYYYSHFENHLRVMRETANLL